MTHHLKIIGRVQGVGFRYSMLNEAHRLGIKGWVKNTRDGHVEAVIQGDTEQIEKMLAWAKKGPSFSEVDHVEVSEAAGTFVDFRIV